MGASSSDPYVPRLEVVYQKGNAEHKVYLNKLKSQCQEINPKVKYNFRTSKFPEFIVSLDYKGKTHLFEERFDGTDASIMYITNMIKEMTKEE